MSAFIEILISLLKIIIEIVVIVGIVWMLLPYVFRFFVAPRFDGSYKYSKDDFEEDGVTVKKVQVTEQTNKFSFNLDKDSHIYNIKFGKDRELSNGIVRIHYDGDWYSTKPGRLEKKIMYRTEVESAEKPIQFKKMKGKFKKIIIEWTLEKTAIRLITKFHMFKDFVLDIADPDLDYGEAQKEHFNFIIFELEFPDAMEDVATGKFDNPMMEFPNLKNLSPNKRMLSFKNGIFSPPTREGQSTNAPRLYFDDDLNTFLITAMDDFIIHLNECNDSVIKCGMEGEINEIEEGYTSQYLLMFDKGINNTFNRMGDILRIYHQKSPKSMYMDDITSYLGYWTDNGAYYYYNPIKKKTISETLVEVNNHIKDIGLPIKYYDLDSWWYVKSVEDWKRTLLGGLGRLLGGGLYGGTIKWEPDPNTMHTEVKNLSELLGTPFIAHNRWYSELTPHKDEFDFYVEGNKAICIDKEFWDMIMTNCENWNIKNYEQDWMNNQIRAFKLLREKTGVANQWLMNMGNAAIEHNRTIQYCMANPGMFLTSVKLDCVSHARAGGDYHPRWPRIYDYRFFAQTSILAYSLRIWPYKDVFRSSCEGIINGEKMPEFMALVSNLSCGPVGPGDKIGKFGKDNLLKTCRNDGLLLKPDKSLTAIDKMFLPHLKYFIASTYSNISNYRWIYVLVNKLTIRQAKNPNVTLKDLNLDNRNNKQFIA
ncbi:MAG: hypothetical protein GF364_18650, partial [Candidatus Lokiarchaeota archaeon]|nr:hypothetical protein [Candidatus Lokiarchaeota archaeon]